MDKKKKEIIPNNTYILCKIFYNLSHYDVAHLSNFGNKFHVTLSIKILSILIVVSNKIEFFEIDVLNMYLISQIHQKNQKYIIWKFVNS